jgi:hypothetical protein
VKHIDVDPDDVHVVVVGQRTYGAPPPTDGSGSPPSFLRRHRLKIAIALTVIELIALGFGDYLRAWIILLAIAIAAVALHLFASPFLPASLRQVTWIIATTQAVVALFPVAFIGASIVVVGILIVGALLLIAMLLLGDRRMRAGPWR